MIKHMIVTLTLKETYDAEKLHDTFNKSDALYIMPFTLTYAMVLELRDKIKDKFGSLHDDSVLSFYNLNHFDLLITSDKSKLIISESDFGI